MHSSNPLSTTPDEQFIVGESDFASLNGVAYRCDGGALLFCRQGFAQVTVNSSQGQVRRNTLILVLPGAMFLLENRSEDFQMSFCAFSRDLFGEAGFRLDPAFFHFLVENPIDYPTASRAESAVLWLKMASYTYQDKENIFRNTIIRNRLQNMLLEIYDKMRRFYQAQPMSLAVTGRRMELFQRFIALVHEHCSHQREVAFYADKLCVSSRYLSSIVNGVTGSSPKEIIDYSVTLELKMLLNTTELSVQEIAYRLNFPDQSYLGRYFKKHTGKSPSEFRNMRN